MVYDNLTVILGTICLANVTIHIISEWRKWQAVRSLSKLLASTSFVVLAVINGAAYSAYGCLILIALIFSWLGNALLLSLRSAFLLGGIASFFLAHAFFAAAFALQPLDIPWFVIALAILGAAGLIFLRWLWKYLEPFYKIAVPIYLAAITIMTALAIAASYATGSPLLAVAAITFAASDVSVARDRFIARSIVNKAWGLPMYYAAQILFAMSVLLLR